MTPADWRFLAAYAAVSLFVSGIIAPVLIAWWDSRTTWRK